MARSAQLQKDIWAQAVAVCQRENNTSATMLVLPALNAMIDITTTRTMAMKIHPPVITFVMLFALGLCCALLAGYSTAGGRKHSWLHMISFAAVLALTVYVILDLEYPRKGLIRLDPFDQPLIELKESMR